MDGWKNRKITTKNGVVKNITKLNKEEIIDLYIKCSSDYKYTIETFFEIFDQTKNKVVSFKLFDFQRKIIDSYESKKLNITNKYRQAGISTVTCAYLACYIAFQENRKVAIVADKLETARDELMRDVVDFIDMLPPFLHPKLSTPNKATHKKYENESEVKAYASKKFRGMTPTVLFWDEVAHCENSDTFWTAVWPSLATGGDCLFVSCVTKDTYIWTDKGLGQMSDFIKPNEKKSYVVEDYHVLGKNKLRTGSLFHNNGVHKTKKIKSGFCEIEGTLSHKLYSYNSSSGKIDWHIMRNVNKGDLLSIQYGKKIAGDISHVHRISNIQVNKKFHTVELQKGMMQIFAHYIKSSESSFNAIPITLLKNVSESQYNLYHSILLEQFELNPNHVNYVDGDLEIKSFRFKNIIEKMGLYEENGKKELSKFILSLKYDLLYELVYQLFEGRFHFETFSFKLIKQLQQLLFNFGYMSIIVDNSTYIGEFSINNSIKLKIVGITEDDFTNNNKVIYDYNIPLGFIDYLNSTLSDSEIPLMYYTRNELKEYISENNIGNQIINDILSDDIYWDIVTDTKKSIADTYDFSLPSDENDFFAHSIVYNGLIGHQTPNGLDPVFYKTYAAAKNGMSKFNINEIYWYEDPRYNKGLKWVRKVSANDPLDPTLTVEESFYDENVGNFDKYIKSGYYPTSPWFEGMCAEYKYDKSKINQELKGDFLGSGNNFIDNDDIVYYEKKHQIDPIRKEFDDNVWIFEEPIKNERYLQISDVSSGTSEDYSTIIILKIEGNLLTQVFEFKGKVSPDVLGEMCYRYGLRYNNAYTIVDITGGIGVTTIQKIMDMGYKNVHYSQIKNENIKDRLISYAKTIDDKTFVPGFTIGTNRGMILIEMKRVIEMREIIICSSRLLSEFRTFLTHPTRVADHRRSFHDDLIIALAMGIYVLAYEIKNPENEQRIRDEMIKAMRMLNGGQDVDVEPTDKVTTNVNKKINPDNDFDTQNHNWLFKNLK